MFEIFLSYCRTLIILFIAFGTCLLQGSIHVIGDSHALEFSTIEGCNIHYLGPRTMHRIGRDGLTILDFRTLGIKEGDTAVLVFGEIDVRCHIGKERDLHNRDLHEVIDALLKNYFRTILTNKSFYEDVRIVTYTVTPPIPEAFNIAYESYGPIEDRVLISKILNQKLIDYSAQLGIYVIDVYEDYADENGILIPELSDGSVHIHTLYNQAIQEKLHAVMMNELDRP